MNEFLITSEHNKNYFVINNGVYSINVLATMLAYVKVDLANILLSAMNFEETRNNLIFVPKSSELGIELNNLIKEKKIVDTSEIITAKHLTNALIKQSLSLNDKGYLQDIKKIIKEQRTGTIEELKEFYKKEILLVINKDARHVWYSSDEVTKKYYNSITLTGYEEAGITFHDDSWYYINVFTDKLVPIIKEDIKIKKKTNN